MNGTLKPNLQTASYLHSANTGKQKLIVCFYVLNSVLIEFELSFRPIIYQNGDAF